MEARGRVQKTPFAFAWQTITVSRGEDGDVGDGVTKEFKSSSTMTILTNGSGVLTGFQQIMLDLKAQGWVESVAGVRGGYILAKRPEKITMGEVVRHFDGILAPISCVSVTRPAVAPVASSTNSLTIHRTRIP
jgi:Iron-dependent Transcriptional regulator